MARHASDQLDYRFLFGGLSAVQAELAGQGL